MIGEQAITEPVCLGIGSVEVAALREGDTVTFDVENRKLKAALSDAEIEERLKDWRDPQPRYETGVFAKYAALVSSASAGAITRPEGYGRDRS